MEIDRNTDARSSGLAFRYRRFPPRASSLINASSHLFRSVTLLGLCGCIQAGCWAQWGDSYRDSLIALLDPDDHSSIQLQRYLPRHWKR